MKREIQRIGVLMGGISRERKISLKSGQAIADALRDSGYEVVVLDFADRAELVAKINNCKADCIFNALHGRFGEDGQVQEILNEFKIPYTGSGVRASQLAMDKAASRQIFQKNGLFVPAYCLIDKDYLYRDEEFGNFPLVVKPVKEGSSIGLSIVEDARSLTAAIEEALTMDQHAIIETYIEGREITVGILEDRPLPVIEVVPKNKFYDFQAKYTPGMTEYIVPADLPKDISNKAQSDALRAHQLLGCRCFSRVDMILDKDSNPVILELNTIPGFTATSLLPKAAAVCGISFQELCQRIVFSAVEHNREKILADS